MQKREVFNLPLKVYDYWEYTRIKVEITSAQLPVANYYCTVAAAVNLIHTSRYTCIHVYVGMQAEFIRHMCIHLCVYTMSCLYADFIHTPYALYVYLRTVDIIAS